MQDGSAFEASRHSKFEVSLGALQGSTVTPCLKKETTTKNTKQKQGWRGSLAVKSTGYFPEDLSLIPKTTLSKSWSLSVCGAQTYLQADSYT